MEFINHNPIIYVISGKSGSGKSKSAEIIKDIYYKKNKKGIILSYATPLKEYAKNILNWDGNEKTKPRSFLQEMGDIVKAKDPNFLIERVIEDIFVYSKFFENIIISDARFRNEIETIKNKFNNVVTVRVDGKANHLTKEQQIHNTETALDDYKDFDYIIENKGTISDLEVEVKKLLGEIK